MSSLRKLENGISLNYDKEIDYKFISDELIDSIFSLEVGYASIDDRFEDEKIINKFGTYSSILKESMKKQNKRKRLQTFNYLNSKYFISNIRYIHRLYEGNIEKEDILELLDKNVVLFHNDIENIKDNYNYLRRQQIIYSEELDKIYIGNNIKNIENKLNDILLNKEKIPIRMALLSVKSDKEHKEELLNNLKLTVKVNCITDKVDVDNTADKYFERPLFNNLKYIDARGYNKRIRFMEDDKYKMYFQTNKSEILETLYKINKNLPEQLDRMSNSPEIDTFMNSLKCVSRKNLASDTLILQQQMRDEFLTNISFVVLKAFTENYFKGNYDDKNLLDTFVKKFEKGEFENEFNNFVLTKEDLKYFENNTIDDYFDIKRRKTKGETKVVNLIRNRLIDSNDFAYKYIDALPQKGSVKDPVFKEELIKKLDNDYLKRIKASKERRRKTVINTTKLLEKSRNMQLSASGEEAKKMAKITNYYLHANDEFDIQNIKQSVQEGKELSDYNRKEDVKELAKKVYNFKNTDLNKNDRLLYNLYNANKLAHSVEDITIFRGIDDNFLMNSTKGEDKNYKTVLLKKYNYLDSFGITVDFVNKALDSYYNNSKLSIYNVLDKNNKQSVIDYLNSILPANAEERLNNNNVDKVIDAFNKIKNNDTNDLDKETHNKKVRDEVELDAKENSVFFAMKRYYTKNVVQAVENKVGKPLEDFTKEDKRELFDEHKFACEYQLDGGKRPVLVCYDNKFNDAFSVHCVNFKGNIDEQKLTDNQIISHHRNQGGLVNNRELNPDRVEDYIKLESGFSSGNTPTTEYSSNVFNKLNFDFSTIGESKKTPISIFKKIQELMTNRAKFIVNGNSKKLIEGTNDTLGDVVSNKTNDSLNAMFDDLLNIPEGEVQIEVDQQQSLFGDNYKFKSGDSEVTLSALDLGDNRAATLNERLNNNKNMK